MIVAKSNSAHGIRSLILGGVAALAFACGGAMEGGGVHPKSGGSVTTGARATDFAARDIDGRTVRLSDHLGKRVILLDFWATFCQPCLAEFPHLNRMYEENKDRGFIIIGVSMDGPETVSDVPAFVRRNNVTFPIVLDEDSRIASVYNPRKSAPLSVLIDKQGRVVKVREGYNPGDEEFVAEDIRNALDQAAAAQ
jgi:peroxiredoxin